MAYSKLGYKRNSPDKNNPYNIIPSGEITMEEVDIPVWGIDIIIHFQEIKYLKYHYLKKEVNYQKHNQV